LPLMPSIDMKKRSMVAKLVYYGPGLSGKTANMRYIHAHLPPHLKSRLTSLATRADSSVRIDVLPVKFNKVLGLDTVFTLYAVPGHAFFNETRKLLLKGTDGIVFVADSRKERHEANIDSLHDLQENLAHHGMALEMLPHVIQYNKRDLPDVMSVPQMRADLNRHGVPDFEASAVTGRGIMETLQAIIAAFSKDLEARI